MNYATIKYYDIANGPGVRTSIFVSGCRHHCPGCFNEVAWDFGYGQPFDKAVRNEIFASCQPDYIAGLSLLQNTQKLSCWKEHSTERTDFHEDSFRGCSCLSCTNKQNGAINKDGALIL